MITFKTKDEALRFAGFLNAPNVFEAPTLSGNSLVFADPESERKARKLYEKRDWQKTAAVYKAERERAQRDEALWIEFEQERKRAFLKSGPDTRTNAQRAFAILSGDWKITSRPALTKMMQAAVDQLGEDAPTDDLLAAAYAAQ